MRYCSLDLETTGTDHDTHQVIEIGAVIDDLEDPKPIDELPSFHCYVDHETYNVSRYVLGMHSDTGIFEEISDYRGGTPDNLYGENEAMERLNTFLTDHISTMVTDLDKVDARGFVNFCGANFTVFDHRFIRSILDRGLKKNADVWDRNRIRAFNPCHFYTLPTDSKPASSWHASKRAGIDEETAHTAVEDAKKMIRLTRRHFGIGDSGKSVARERVSDARNQANEIANQMYGNIESARKRAREFLSAAQQAKEAFGKMRDS